MEIEFQGAAECVTGSCHILRFMGKTILLDCGSFVAEDDDEGENEDFDFDVKLIDYVILSHAHIDHSGRIPLLFKRGCRGKVICTNATKDLCGVMLKDSGHIAEMEAEWINRKRMRLGQEPIEPIYTVKDAEYCMTYFEGHEYDEEIQVFEGFKLVFKDAGHILGAAMSEIYVKEKNAEEVKLVYSGDIGNINIPIINDPTYIEKADYVIMETTYGNKQHSAAKDEQEKLVQIIDDTFKRGGNVIIPSFAVGRTQELIYALNGYVENKLLKNVKVFVDSPLAQESTKIFQKYNHIYDKEARELVEKGDDPLSFEGLIFTKSAEESAGINTIKSGIVIISSSGMCDAGRIKHHLKHNLWRKECSVVFVGYQAQGTLGRKILDGAKKVKIFGEDIAVNAKVYNLHGLSGHADKNGLLTWVNSFRKKPKEIMLVHGDKEVLGAFQRELSDKGFNVSIMKKGERRHIGTSEVKEIYLNENIKEELLKYVTRLGNYYISNADILKDIEAIISNSNVK